MTDSVFNQENYAKLSTLETKYNLEKLEKELAFAEEQKRSANLQNLLIIISVVSVSAILLLVINRKRIKNRKDKEISELKLQQARREIEQNRNELRVFAARIKEKNKLIENLLQEFNQTNKEDLDMDGSGTELQLRKMKILSKEDWIKFKTLFRSVHQDFIERFSERFHHLTEGDLRQVMLIKLGFTLSQTADILGIGYAGVKKARQRLARKIDLGNTDSLVGFIDQFPEKGA